MATVLQQVLDRIDAILKAQVPVGCSVFRDRQDAESRAEAPSVNVKAKEGQVEPWSEMDKHEALVHFSIYVRAEPGVMACEDVHNSFHAGLMTDGTLANLCESRRLVEFSFDGVEADTTATHKVARYRFIYLIPKATL